MAGSAPVAAVALAGIVTARRWSPAVPAVAGDTGSTRRSAPVSTMSSATSTDSLQPRLPTLAGLIGATVVVFVSRGQTPAGIILLSLTIFAAAVVGLGGVANVWTAVVMAEDGSGPQILGGRTRRGRARKDTRIEIHQGVGSIAPWARSRRRIFAEMSAWLRARAAGLIRQLDAGGVYREEIEKEIARRVKPSHSESSRVASKQARLAPLGVCAACATANDADARFCKHCGASLGRTA